MKLTTSGNLLYVILAILNLGCKKFVQIAAPTTQIVTSSVFSSNATATSAQLAIYSQMETKNESASMALNLGLLGDELTNFNLSNILDVQFYTNAMSAVQSPGPWVNGYNYIYQANAVIQGVNGNSSLSSAVEKQLLGEAKFIRAFWFFYLTNLYGPIPLTTTSNYAANATLSRTPNLQVYQQIISDLKDAKVLLNSNFVDASDTTITTTDRTRPTRWAAAALLARTYLYMSDNQDAERESDSIINQGSLFSLYTNLDSVFLVNSKEAIWQLGIPLPTNYNTYDATQFILTSAPGSSIGCCAISTQLLNSFQPGDIRRIHWVDSFQTKTSPKVTYYFPYKYKVASGTTVTEDVMVFRFAEQYLIRSEARAQQGNIAGAVSDLNTIRQRAKLGLYNGTMDQQTVLSAILHERQVELFTEWGHRWLDLIRTNNANSVMSVVTPTTKGGTWNSNLYQTLFPIPATEITSDVNLTQNLGY